MIFSVWKCDKCGRRSDDVEHERGIPTGWWRFQGISSTNGYALGQHVGLQLCQDCSPPIVDLLHISGGAAR